MQEPGESRGASRWCGSRRGASGARPAGLVEQRPLRLAGLTREACGTRTRGAGSRARGPAAAPRRRRDPLGVRLLRCRPAGQGWCPAPVGRARCGVRDASLEWARRLVVCRCGASTHRRGVGPISTPTPAATFAGGASCPAQWCGGAFRGLLPVARVGWLGASLDRGTGSGLCARAEGRRRRTATTARPPKKNKRRR